MEVALPEDDLQTDRNSFCNIGRVAEVRFQRAGLMFLDSIERSLARFFDYVKHEIARPSRRESTKCQQTLSRSSN